MYIYIYIYIYTYTCIYTCEGPHGEHVYSGRSAKRTTTVLILGATTTTLITRLLRRWSFCVRRVRVFVIVCLCLFVLFV